jgi:hypothetical protein
VKYILQRAREKGEEVYEKTSKIIEEGRARGSLRLEGFEKRVEVEGREHVVKVIGGRAKLEESRRGRKLLRLTITAEVDGVKHEYEMIYGRNNTAVDFAVARANAPGDREADAERLSALVKALTGRGLGVYRMKNGKIIIKCYGGRLEDFTCYAELADAIKKWLEETRQPPHEAPTP